MKPNARTAAVPRPAAEAALADETGATLRRALWLDALDQRFHPLLPPGLAPHCRLANVSGGQLVLVTDSPVWRARLRLAEAELLDAARSIGLTVERVEIRVAKAAPIPRPAPEKPASPASRAAVEEAIRLLGDPD